MQRRGPHFQGGQRLERKTPLGDRFVVGGFLDLFDGHSRDLADATDEVFHVEGVA